MRLIPTAGMRWLIIDNDNEEYARITKYDGAYHLYQRNEYGNGFDHLAESTCIAHALEEGLPGIAVSIPTAVKQSRHYHG